MHRLYTQNFSPLQIALITDKCSADHISRHFMDHEVHVIRPRLHEREAPSATHYRETLVACIPIPGFPEIKSGVPSKRMLLKLWEGQRPDIVHISTECLLGWSALSAARKLHIPVSTDVDSVFHRHVQRHPVLKSPISAYLRHFHNKAACTLVADATLQQRLRREGYRNVRLSSNGLDSEVFHPARGRVKAF